MGERPDYWCVVLQDGGDCLVCVRRDSVPNWLQIIATFTDRERAKGYAEVQNMWFEDTGMDIDKDLQVPAPTIAPPPDKLPTLRITARETRTHTVREITAEEIEQPQIKAPIENDEEPVEEEDSTVEQQAGRIPDLIMRLLPGWMEKFPAGPTIKQVVAETKLPEDDVRAAFTLLKSGPAVVYHGRETRALHVLPPGSAVPEQPELSVNQEAVLGYLEELPANADGAVEPPSWDHISDAAKVPKGSIGSVLDDLERKGKIEIVATKRGSGSTMQKTRYKVVDRQILQQALRAGSGPKDASHLVFDDPPPGQRRAGAD